MRFIVGCILVVLLAAAAHADLVSVSQLGYHPASYKQAVVYTSASSGTFEVRSGSTVVYSGTLQKATTLEGSPVQCQGNLPCLVADFSALTTPGTYTVRVGSDTSAPFTISNTVFSSNAALFSEFFEALDQQGSDYHVDYHTAMQPAFPAMADGSFIMVSDQAATTLIRLGSAYRRNPSVVDDALKEHMAEYAQYLASLQGVQVQERTDGTGVRINFNVEPVSAFVPGPTSLSQLTVYKPDNTVLKTVPVTSLCGADDGAAAWDKCIADAALYYKCQINEPCLNMKYIERTGTITYDPYNFAVSRGYAYDFGCYVDVQPSSPLFASKMNPCMVFEADTSRARTVETLHAFLQAVPAIDSRSSTQGRALFDRSLHTYNYIKTTYGTAFSANSEEAAHFGAALFLLYNYTGNTTYLQEAVQLGQTGKVSSVFSSGSTHGNEYYWEEYVRNRAAITAAGLPYTVNGDDPAEYFRGQMYKEYKDAGPSSIQNSAERVFQLYRDTNFQNSRQMLSFGVLAAKTKELYPSVEPFVPVIADTQIAWLTGMNAVQDGVALGSPLKSQSFIVGIGDDPDEYHSRYLINSGYAAASNNQVVGFRGTSLKFFNGTHYVYLDGRTEMLGQVLGASGNEYNGEARVTHFVNGVTFSNGRTEIPGWINGAFDTPSDQDIIYNYHDDRDTYEYTETTNEMVATAVEYFAYLDGRYNNRARAASPLYLGGPAPITPANNTPPTNSTNTTQPGSNSTCAVKVNQLPVSCTGTVSQDTYDGACRSILCTTTSSSLRVLACDKPNGEQPTSFEMYKQSQSGAQLTVCLGETCIGNNGFAQKAYPVCTGNATTPSNTTNTTQPPTNSTTNTTQPPSNSTNSTCVQSVQFVQASCTGGTISQDTFNGCRQIVCGATGKSLQVLACDKPGSTNPTHFEMYKQSSVGSGVQICLGSTCISDNGFAKSAPFCSAPPTNTTQPPPTNSTTNTTQPPGNSTNSSASVDIAPWFPQGRNYVFVCSTPESTPTSYDWNFGDGQQQKNSNRKDVYHTYSAAGTYTVSCVARGTTTLTASRTITVS